MIHWNYDTALQLLCVLPFLAMLTLLGCAGCEDRKRQKHFRVWLLALANLLIALSWIRDREFALRPNGLFIQVFCSGILALIAYQMIIIFFPGRLK